MSRNPLEQDGEVLPMGSNVDMLSTINPDAADDEKATPVYEKYDALLHGTTRKRTDEYLSVDFMRKYIRFVKLLKPTLTEEASEIIADEYSRLRSEDVLDNDVARVSNFSSTHNNRDQWVHIWENRGKSGNFLSL